MANTVIGRVVATEKNPTTIDNFTFWTDPELILNPFDIVKVQHVNNSFSYGVIEDIAHITDAASFLTNFISSDFGDVNAEENTLRVGMNYVSAKVDQVIGKMSHAESALENFFNRADIDSPCSVPSSQELSERGCVRWNSVLFFLNTFRSNA